jgi:ubiquinone/menaquinone biosynthesis C-methylase UbiE
MRREFIPALSWKGLTPLFDFWFTIIGLGNRFRRKIVRTLPIKHKDSVMDAGCGTGSLAIELKKKHPEVDVIGIDADAQILDVAKRKTKKENLSINYSQAFLQKLPFKDNYFDIVYSSLVFHHLNSQAKQDSMKEIYRVLKKSGRFLLVDFGKPRNKFFPVFSWFSVLVEEGRDNYEGRIPRMLQAAGFRNVKEIARDKYNIVFVRAVK